MSTTNFSKGDIILLAYPFTDLKAAKVRPAVVVSSGKGKYADVFVVPITSRTDNLGEGGFVLTDWQGAGLNVASAIKRGCVLVDIALIKKREGMLTHTDLLTLTTSLKAWLEL